MNLRHVFSVYLLFFVFFLVRVLIWVFTFSYDGVYVSPSASPCNYTDTFLFSECCACIFFFCQSLLQVVTTISFTVGMLTSVQRKHIFGLLFVKEIWFVFTVVRFCFNNATHEKKVSGLLSNTKSMHCVFAVCLFLSGESFLGTASFQ